MSDYSSTELVLYYKSILGRQEKVNFAHLNVGCEIPSMTGEGVVGLGRDLRVARIIVMEVANNLECLNNHQNAVQAFQSSIKISKSIFCVSLKNTYSV